MGGLTVFQHESTISSIRTSLLSYGNITIERRAGFFDDLRDRFTTVNRRARNSYIRFSAIGSGRSGMGRIPLERSSVRIPHPRLPTNLRRHPAEVAPAGNQLKKFYRREKFEITDRDPDFRVKVRDFHSLSISSVVEKIDDYTFYVFVIKQFCHSTNLCYCMEDGQG